MSRIVLSEESYQVIGSCLEVHNYLGPGLAEVVYKDALQIEFNQGGIPCSREVHYEVAYKGQILKHAFYADFVVYDQIILEIKATTKFNDLHIAQCLNYLKISGNPLAILVNFGDARMTYKRIVL